jgi:tetratricopeptide (TPR) repeat protein
LEKPLTEAERRSKAIKATRGPRDEQIERAAPPPWEREEWVDEGSVRHEAEAAAERAAGEAPTKTGRRKSMDLAPEVAEDLANAAPAARQARYQERLASAADALDRGRFADARRMVQPVLRDLPDLAFAHEISGLALYRMGQWRKAAAELEVARQLTNTVQHHAVLADCYRALRRYHDVDVLWGELRDASPEPALMAEGRIVAAGALADQGDMAGALKVMQKATELPKKPKEYHLRQWYVLADLLDRSGDVIKARRFFTLVAEADREFGDVRERLKTLGR